MANQRKLIGRLPVFKGEWSSLETYNKLNEVTLYGSSFRSKIDGNTYKPAELNEEGTGMTVNENWYVVANGTDAYLAGEKIASIDGNTSTYNVSRFHQHTGFWEAVEYDESEPAYLEAQEYTAGNRVNLVNYTNHTFVAMKDMTGVMPDYNNISNKFTLEEAILFVPSKYRLTGMNVGFLDSSNKPVVHKHKGGTFTNVANWEEDVQTQLTELSVNFDYALLIGVPELDTTVCTFTIKKGTQIIGGGLKVTTTKDLVVNKGEEYNSHYIIVDTMTEKTRLIDINSVVHTDISEVVIALVRWTECVYQGNFRSYKLNDTTIDLKLNRNKFPYYALLYNTIPKLDTSAKTFTLPSNSHILSNAGSVLLSDDLTYTQEECGADSNSHILILNINTLEKRAIKTGEQFYLKDNEVVIALVRWIERVYQANFPKYYLNDTLISLNPDRDYGGEIDCLNSKSGEELASNSYYQLDVYEVGDKVESLNLTPISRTFYNYHFVAQEGDKVIIKGLGSSSGSRLYMFVSIKTRLVTAIADAGIDARTTPLEFTFDEETEVYGTSTSSNCYVKIYRNIFDTEIKSEKTFFDYIGLVPYASTYPELNTSLETFTLKAGSHLYGNGLDLTLSDDIVVNKPDASYGSHYIIINKDKEIRIVDANKQLMLRENESVVCLLRWATGIIQANFFKYYLDGSLVDFKPLGKTSIDVFAPKMYNPSLNLQKEQLKILDIGNSYTEDSTHYLPQIVTASGIDISNICLYKAIRGSASFKTWYDCYYDKDNATYGINKVLGGLDANITGTAAANNGEKFRNTLENNKWDLIIIHQVSTYAPYYDRWEEDSNAGYLSKFIRLLRKHQPQATIGFLLVHSYWSGYSGNTEKSSLERWKLIAESAMKLRANYGIDFIIPYGTAIQNLRASSLNNDYDLTADGTHCANGIADYTAACAYYQSLFAPRYGVNILGNTARIDVEQTETYPSSDISVTDENAETCQKAAFLACYSWYECQNPENFDI